MNLKKPTLSKCGNSFGKGGHEDQMERAKRNLNSSDCYHKTQPWEFYFVRLMMKSVFCSPYLSRWAIEMRYNVTLTITSTHALIVLVDLLVALNIKFTFDLKDLLSN